MTQPVGPRIGVVGAGAWGTALALVTRRAGREVLIWAHGSDVVAAINERHENPLLLPGVALDPAIRATGDMSELSGCGVVLLAPPARLCTDNAAMIAWAGIERLQLGQQDGLDFAPRPRWPLDPTAPKAVGAGVKA